MSWTKRQFVDEALDELGLGSYTYDLDPAELQAAIRKLDAMISAWHGRGIHLGFPLTSSPEDSDLDTETDVSDTAAEAIYKNLAIRLAPSYGKTVSRETRLVAKEAYTHMVSREVVPEERRIDGLPSGSGNKDFRYANTKYISESDDLRIAGEDLA